MEAAALGDARGERRWRRRRWLGLTGFSLIAVFGLIQLVPYGHSHTNPPVTKAVVWPTP